ncbi:hypothetical protein PHYPSEUDO_011068 [Phytophthora pseudosyringae]|uniref:RxLR effector protein n=1 Tax=Phytophthora pseudosyringae TaxID=221518 RepID=A0A8T1V9L1_9STRA|nr:hypothetical protein PHYPSEUDO_011068 [Phytophthora pseudosyringae]
MRLSSIIIVAAVALLAIDNASSAPNNNSNPNKAKLIAALSDGDISNYEHGKSNIRSHNTAAAEEERAFFGDFATSKLKKMLTSESFKLDMFKKWDAHSVGHISEKLKVDIYHPRWADLLFEYLNVYKKAGDEVVKHARNGKKVTFSNEIKVRFYPTNS